MDGYCSCYAVKPYGSNGSYSGENSVFWAHTSGSLRVRDNRFTDVTNFLNSVGSEQLVLPLITPITVTLDANTMSLLLGENNLWADTGDTSVGYRADTRRYIDSKLSAAVAELQALILDN